MDHNEDRIENEEDIKLTEILCKIIGNESFKQDFARLIGGLIILLLLSYPELK